MQRFVASLFLLAALGAAQAQTIKINTANGPCTYPTGTVTSDPATPGQLVATVPSGQAGTGTGCGTSGGTAPVSFGPASQLTASGATTVSNSGGTVNFTFQPLNATACTASSTPSGATFSTMCSSASGCQSLQNLTVTLPANPSNTTDVVYTIAVSCTGPGSPTGITSSVNPITVSHGSVVTSQCITVPSSTAGITNYTQLTGTQPVNFFGGGTASKDVTSFDAIYDTWPGNPTTTADIGLATNKYVSEKFHVPVGYMAGYTNEATNPLYGNYKINTSGYSAPISMTISTTCGDFSNPTTYPSSTVVPGCWKNKLLSGGYIQWRKSTTCILQDDTTYYFNFINADISLVQPNGGGTAASTKNANCGTSCSDPIKDEGSFSTYTFP